MVINCHYITHRDAILWSLRLGIISPYPACIRLYAIRIRPIVFVQSKLIRPNMFKISKPKISNVTSSCRPMLARPYMCILLIARLVHRLLSVKQS